MTFVFSRLKSSPRDMVMSRYTSEDDPCTSVREMLAHLEATYGDPHASTTAYRTFSRLGFDIKKDGINDFISKVNTLADKSRYPEEGAQDHAVQLPAFGFRHHGSSSTSHGR
ncbi:hypothetical protein E4U30_007567 [Claviceps sp. LM220 group G6]|nr:hypothetical protein E4U30_007567 [Claviceps sp. LM220 group G6]